MVGGIVKEDNSISSPIRSFLIKLIDQSLEEDLHNFGIRIGLNKGKVDLAFSV